MIERLHPSEFGDQNSIEKENQENFHFEAMNEVEPAMEELVGRMKERIDSNSYDTLVSDDIGGRVPTLVLRKIIQNRNPEEKLQTHFISAGKRLSNPDALQSVAKALKSVHSSKRTLLITQYVHTGRTLLRLSEELKKAGIKNLDVFVLNANQYEWEEEEISKLHETLDAEGEVFVGSISGIMLDEKHEALSGVRKPTDAQLAHPKRTADVIAEEGRILSDEEWREVFEWIPYEKRELVDAKLGDPKKKAEWKKRTNVPLSPDEKLSIQRDIRLAREDVNTMVEKVIEKVWD